jgi:uncharacterized protein
MIEEDYRTQVVRDLKSLPIEQWQSLINANGYMAGNAFLNPHWLAQMQATGCVDSDTVRDTGWQPEFILLWDEQNNLVAACPLYRKFHSYGEYVFDWAWANAYQQHGLAYYPKLLSAIPFTPVSGQRLIARSEGARSALTKAVLAHAKAQRVSSFHLLLPPGVDQASLNSEGLMARKGVQFHWHNRNANGEQFADFEEFLATLTQPKRKKIRAERRKVAEQNIVFTRLIGKEITAADWAFFYRCYERTYLEHHSTPYLNQAFFQSVGEKMPEAFVLIKASFEGTDIAASLLMRDEQRMYGRYWGALAHVPCLHFEACYYQAIQAAIDLRIEILEGGAQGEHKMARGFLPQETSSAHWLAEPAFADAVQRFLDRESAGMETYMDELTDRTPFKAA